MYLNALTRHSSMKKAEIMQIPNALGGCSDMEKVFYSSASRVLSANAIPTTYEGLGVTGIAFGENAYSITSENLNNGLIIDALAAKILTDMGTDVGIESFGEGKTVKYQYFCDDENYIIAVNCTAYDICLSHNCKILSYVSN